MTRTALYLSPHFDDVALSCAGGVLAKRARGDRVIVCSVFTQTRNRTVMHRRSGEDATAWFRAGVESVDLRFDDAPDREGLPKTFTALMLGPPPSAALVKEVRAAIAVQIRRFRPDEVWFPLAIGGHVDHRAVFEARAAAGKLRTYFYADRPYAFVPALRDLRHAELAGSRASTRWNAEAVARQLKFGGCDRFVVAAERAAVCAELAARLAAARTPTGQVRKNHTFRYPMATLAAVVSLIECYRSQTRALFGTTEVARLWKRNAEITGGWYETASSISTRRP